MQICNAWITRCKCKSATQALRSRPASPATPTLLCSFLLCWSWHPSKQQSSYSRVEREVSISPLCAAWHGPPQHGAGRWLARSPTSYRLSFSLYTHANVVSSAAAAVVYIHAMPRRSALAILTYRLRSARCRRPGVVSSMCRRRRRRSGAPPPPPRRPSPPRTRPPSACTHNTISQQASF